MRLRGTVLVLMVLLGGNIAAQELSTSVFLSEDELDEALRNGELTYEQYQNLKEIIQYGIDSVSQYLLDQIPNLMYLLDVDQMAVETAEKDQVSGFRARSRSARSTGSVTWRYTTPLGENTRSWYRSAIDLRPAERWRMRMHVNRESSGAERVTSRSVNYQSRSGLIRRLEIGSFTTRFGLGTTFGYRGKLLDFSKELDGESFVYPDYGGYNGVSAELRSGSTAVRSLSSVVRDERHQLTSAGMLIEDTDGSFRPGAVLGVNRVEERAGGGSTTIPIAALLMQIRYGRGSLATELGCQDSKASNSACAVLEGQHRFQTVEMRYAGWYYGKNFVDLTGGSKSGLIYVSDSLESVGFGFRSRRTGQIGGMVKTHVELADQLVCSGALLYADVGAGSRRQQFSGSFTCKFDRDWRVLLTYLGRWQRQPDEAPVTESDHQWRLEERYDAAPWLIRCYIGYENDRDRRELGSLFASVRYETKTGERYQVWSNMGKIGEDGIVYWYLCGRGEWALGERVTAAAKLSNSHRREAAKQSATQFSVELTVNL